MFFTSAINELQIRSLDKRLVLGAIDSFLSTLSENRPRFLKELSKLSLNTPTKGLAWILVVETPDLCHTSSDSGDLQYK